MDEINASSKKINDII
ncbi:hypothetical protein, partial [Rhizobacter sp. Root29]